MHHHTVKFVEHLQNAIKKNTRKWQNKYSGSILGIHISRKIRKGKRKRYFCVVFHVDQKLENLPPEKKLPKYIKINIPGRGIVNVPTDVVVTGESKLANSVFPCSPGSRISQRGEPEYGTMGPIVSKSDRYYILSNMHVLGVSYLKQGLTNKTVSLTNQVSNIVVYKDNRKFTLGCFERGRFSPSIDAAIARIPNQQKISNIIHGIGTPTGYKTLKTIDIYGDEYSVNIVGSVSGVKSGIITSNNAIKAFDTLLGNKNFYQLLQIEPNISAKGDSGAAIIDQDNNILGILLGGDSAFSYAIPIEPILATFNLNIVTEANFT